MDTVDLVRRDAAATLELGSGTVVPLFLACHPDPTGFHSGERFAQRLRAYCGRPGFEHLLALAPDGTPVGQAFGFALPAGTAWWEGLQDPVPPGLTREDGRRTFALAELMVLPGRRRHGLGRRLHDTLLAGRTERRATLLVRTDNTAARTAYRRWGWQEVGPLRPFLDAPTFLAMLLELPVAAAG